MADYMRPLVLVYQELRNVSATLPNPTLPGVLVGPGYHIQTYAADKASIYCGTYDKTAGNTVSMPNPVAGMKVVADSVSVYFDDCYATIESKTDGVTVVDDVSSLNKLVSAGSLFVTKGVKVGDYVTVTKGANTISTRVQSVVNETTLLLAKNAGFASTGATVLVTRQLNDVVVDASFLMVDEASNSVEISNGVTTAIGSLTCAVTAAKIYVAYNALRTDICVQPLDITSTSDIETKLGRIVPENPIAFGANLMFSAAATSFQVLGVESTDLVGFSTARDILASRDVYVIGMLTDDAAIVAMMKNHCEAMSVPAKNKFRCCIGNHQLTTVSTLVGNGTAGAMVTDPATTKIIFFDDATAEFQTAGVAAGDELVIGANTYVVDSVANENRLVIMANNPFSAEGTGVAYTVVRTLTKTQQAEAIAATSKSLKSKRCIMTWPNVVVYDDVELPGYYLNAILAGMICGLPSQAGLTNKGVSGIDAVRNSNFYFTDDQLDIIAAGGTCVFVQQTESSLPYIRHQLTTDMDLLETKEISVVKNNDYLSIFFRDLLKKFLGEWNVTTELLGVMSQAINAGIDFQRLAKLPKIGSPLIAASIKTLEISSISADRVEVYIETTQPRPLNNIGLHMIL